MKSTIAKKTEGYGYKYTELADINKYCEDNGIRYYQEIETCELNQKDYIITYVTENEETKRYRGCQIVEAKLSGINNPVQAYGSSLTYCRRYSLLLALGLACEDNDGADLGEPTIEEAENFTFEKGKHSGWTLKKVIEEDQKFLKWLLNNSEDQRLLKMIELLTGEKPLTDEEWDERFDINRKLKDLIVEKDLDVDKICEYYKVDDIGKLTTDQKKEIIEKRG